jgi:hypothetical protein
MKESSFVRVIFVWFGLGFGFVVVLNTHFLLSKQYFSFGIPVVINLIYLEGFIWKSFYMKVQCIVCPKTIIVTLTRAL